MAYHGMDSLTDTYEIFVDNVDEENNLKDDDRSTAGQFTVHLQPFLDLSSLLYLRSVQAEIALDRIEVGSLPVTFSRQEQVQTVLEIPLAYSTVNQWMNHTELKALNSTALVLPLTDHVCSEPKQVVDFFNETFQHRINYFLLTRFLNLFFDDEVLDVQCKSGFKVRDLRLLNRYIDVALFTRQVLHDIMCKLIDVQDDSVARTAIYSNLKEFTSERVEARIINESKTIKSVEERRSSRAGKTVTFSLFYGVDVSKVNELRTAAQKAVETEILRWLTKLDLDPTVTAEGEDADFLRENIASNKKLIQLGMQCRNLVQLEKDRLDGRVPKTSLFHLDVISISLDYSGQKCSFSLQPKKFLSEGCQLSVFLPEQMSYAMGAQVNQRVNIGPLTWNDETVEVPRLTHEIKSENQQLPFAIRTYPTIIHVVTDIVAGKGRDTWLRDSSFTNYRIIYSHLIDESAIANRAIASTDCGNVFYKIRESHNLLETMRFALLDQNLRKIEFSQRTYTRMSFKIKPVSIE